MTILLGTIVMIAWILDLPRLKSVFPGSVAMKANTALGFILCGVSLLLLGAGRTNPSRRATQRGALVLAGIVTFLGVVTVLEYGLELDQAGLFGTEFGIAAMTVVNIAIFGALILWIATVTEAKETGDTQSGDQLRESEDRFRITFEQSAIGSATVSIDGRVIYVNDRICDLLGYAREELLNLDLREITHPDDLNTDRGLIRSLLAGEIPSYALEKRYIRKNGSTVFGNLTVSLVRTKSGEPNYFIAAIEDITERRHAEAELSVGSARLIDEIVQRRKAEDALRQMNRTLESRVAERTAELEDAVKELEAFSYSVSHDLRAPLRAINGFSKILATKFATGLAPEAQEGLERIRSNTEYMGRLIDDLLSFSRLIRQPVRTSTVEPERLVSHCLELLGDEIDGRDVQIVKEELPQCKADPMLLELVWMNLLSNAIKFTRHRDGARIEIGAHRNGRTVYYVRDNGVGFSMAYADKLFGVFQRLHRAEDYEGTGVGLATVRRVIQRHGGRIWAEAEAGRGAAFYFTVGPEVSS